VEYGIAAAKVINCTFAIIWIYCCHWFAGNEYSRQQCCVDRASALLSTLCGNSTPIFWCRDCDKMASDIHITQEHLVSILVFWYVLVMAV